MLLGIYLGTSVVSFATVVIFSKACENKIKRDGYKFVKRSTSENLVDWLCTIFKSFIPVYNVLNTVILFLSGDKLFNRIEEKLLKEGKIYMPQNEDEDNKTEKEPIYSNINEVKNEKKFEDMTIEEKKAYLEQEKEKLLQSFDKDKKEQNQKNGPVLRKVYKRDDKFVEL